MRIFELVALLKLLRQTLRRILVTSKQFLRRRQQYIEAQCKKRKCTSMSLSFCPSEVWRLSNSFRSDNILPSLVKPPSFDAMFVVVPKVEGWQVVWKINSSE